VAAWGQQHGFDSIVSTVFCTTWTGNFTVISNEAITALYATLKVAAEALSRAGGFRIRALKVGVRVVRRSGQGRGESRSSWLVRVVVAVSEIKVSSSSVLAIVIMAVVVVFGGRGEGLTSLETFLTTEGLFSAHVGVLASSGRLAEELR
jgi:hypothetical protein